MVSNNDKGDRYQKFYYPGKWLCEEPKNIDGKFIEERLENFDYPKCFFVKARLCVIEDIFSLNYG